jgi:hypothetical protein
MTALVLNTTGILDISHIPNLKSQIRQQLKDGISPEKIWNALLVTIWIWDKFTSRALRSLSGTLPAGIVPREGIADHIREIVESKKRNPEPIVLWNLLGKTNFIWKDMQVLMQNWTSEALVWLNNLIYDMVLDKLNIWDNSIHYIHTLELISSQLKHKEGIQIESGNFKTIYGSITTSPDRRETPRERKVYKLHINKQWTSQ